MNLDFSLKSKKSIKLINYSMYGIILLIFGVSAFFSYAIIKEHVIDVATGESLQNMTKKKGIIIEDIDMVKFEKVKARLEKKQEETRIDRADIFK